MSPFQGGMIVATPLLAVSNIVQGSLPNSSSYEDGMSLFIGVVLYIHNAVYGHFSSWAFFKRTFIVPIVLSTAPLFCGGGMGSWFLTLCLNWGIPS